MPTIATTLRSYITNRFLTVRKIEFTNDDSLLKSGVLDVFELLELIALLENHYLIRFDDRMFEPNDLDTVNKLVQVVEGHLLSAAMKS